MPGLRAPRRFASSFEVPKRSFPERKSQIRVHIAKRVRQSYGRRVVCATAYKRTTSRITPRIRFAERAAPIVARAQIEPMEINVEISD